MGDTIRIQLMDTFNVYINERKEEHLAKKSRKGVSLMQYLMLNRGQPVPNYRLLVTLWSDEGSANPENALKTLVSRLRAILNQITPGFGNCIVADRGAYHWEMLPGMTVDYYQIEELFDELGELRDDQPELIERYEKLLVLYKGDLLQNCEQNVWALAQATSLHNKYMSAIYSYIELLKSRENYQDIIRVCRMALNVDNFDDRLHMELMTALIHTNRTNEALVQYKHVTHLNYRYLGVQPSEDMQEFYKQIVRAGKTLEFSLEGIRNELRESGEQRGAFVCEYAVFKEIYNLQMRNLERLGSTMFLGVIMVGNPEDPTMDSIKQDNIMNGTLEILKNNLRKGDTITHFSPTIFALLLPTVNYSTGNMVMERVKQLFYKKFPNSNIPFNYRIGPLSSRMEPEESV
ncbi:MAG: winged helix-turn-helix domain-containing protein [Clostridia bacterium]|nr:winged helix-turn-helix domain-containing protein [Clostridia bacterium]MBR6753799.1 winged helix-turn-helix domain-containing protein [Clostridia bacterium]